MQAKRAKKKKRPPPMVLKAGDDTEDKFWKACVAANHEPTLVTER